MFAIGQRLEMALEEKKALKTDKISIIVITLQIDNSKGFT